VFIGLHKAKRVEQLADEHSDAGRRRLKHMYGSYIAVFAACASEAFMADHCNIRRLTRRRKSVRIRTRLRYMHQGTQIREVSLEGRWKISSLLAMRG
jgi:hypothetical protein